VAATLKVLALWISSWQVLQVSVSTQELDDGVYEALWRCRLHLLSVGRAVREKNP